jgi:hypothetical protein
VCVCTGSYEASDKKWNSKPLSELSERVCEKSLCHRQTRARKPMHNGKIKALHFAQRENERDYVVKGHSDIYPLACAAMAYLVSPYAFQGCVGEVRISSGRRTKNVQRNSGSWRNSGNCSVVGESWDPKVDRRQEAHFFDFYILGLIHHRQISLHPRKNPSGTTP